MELETGPKLKFWIQVLIILLQLKENLLSVPGSDSNSICLHILNIMVGYSLGVDPPVKKATVSMVT